MTIRHLSIAIFTALAIALVDTPLSVLPANAQTSTRDAKIGTFVSYGMDNQRIRLDKIQRIARIDGRPYVRTVDPGDGHMSYLILTLTVENSGRAAPALPTLVSTLKTNARPAMSPSVSGPYVNNATTQADQQTKIPPHETTTIYLALIDIPNGQRVTDLTLSPNDTTPEYHYRLRPGDITALKPIPRHE
ncbi:MAG: hypothetical protein IAI50_03875 [Candidatus Eremiobacteraeota bacterium]|nr:hypothetical protein [Candidatus Eremiobacteraeota bacterium]